MVSQLFLLTQIDFFRFLFSEWFFARNSKPYWTNAQSSTPFVSTFLPPVVTLAYHYGRHSRLVLKKPSRRALNICIYLENLDGIYVFGWWIGIYLNSLSNNFGSCRVVVVSFEKVEAAAVASKDHSLPPTSPCSLAWLFAKVRIIIKITVRKDDQCSEGRSGAYSWWTYTSSNFVAKLGLQSTKNLDNIIRF